MDYRIIVDSCGELTEEMKESGIYETAPLSMEVGGVTVIDDETFDQADFSGVLRPVRNVRNHPARPRKNIWNCTAAVQSGYMQ